MFKKLRDFFAKYKNDLYTVVIIASSVFLMIRFTSSIGSTVDSYARERRSVEIIDSLNTVINSQSDSIKYKDAIIVSINKQIEVIDKALDQNNKQLELIKKDRDEKISNVDKYNANDISEYFYKRYGTGSKNNK